MNARAACPSPLARMVHMLEQENAMLLGQDFAQAATLGAEKAQILAELVRLAPVRQDTEAVQELRRLAEVNARLLSAAVALQSRLVEVLAQAMRDAVGKPATYAAAPITLRQSPILVARQA